MMLDKRDGLLGFGPALLLSVCAIALFGVVCADMDTDMAADRQTGRQVSWRGVAKNKNTKAGG